MRGAVECLCWAVLPSSSASSPHCDPVNIEMCSEAVIRRGGDALEGCNRAKLQSVIVRT
jgi:hypothetical protein